MAEAPKRRNLFGFLEDYPLLRIILYYVLLSAALTWLDANVPAFHDGFMGGSQAKQITDFSRESFEIAATGAQEQMAKLGMGTTTLIAMAVAFLLTLPVVWLYAFTRHKRGYQQSLAQTLLILPVVVSGVVILVQGSIPLAFSLGGIVGALAFRNRLEDTKDAVHVFLSIAIGLSAGVQSVPIGLAISSFFNLVMLTLWWTDFGRIPGDLQAPVAQKRMEMVKEMTGEAGKRSEKLVTALDQQLLQSMTPEQLQLLADKALDRKSRMSHELLDTDETEERFEGTVRITTIPGASADTIRETVEKVLARDAKEWSFAQAGMGDEGRTTLDWQVRSKKSVPRPILLEAIRRAIAGQAEVTFK
jgi:hypothetical protein